MSNPNWADLNPDLLTSIVILLDWYTDIPRVRGVCKSWRSCLSRSSLLSLKFPKLPSRFDPSSLELPPINLLEFSTSIRLVENRFYLISPLDDKSESQWLAQVRVRGFDKALKLLNPAKQTNKYLTTNPPVIGEINLLDCSILQLSKPMCLLCTDPSAKLYHVSTKVVGGWNLNSTYRFAILVLLAPFECGSGLIFWRLHDRGWTYFKGTFPDDDDEPEARLVLDVAFHHGKFYAINASTWRVGVLDPDEVTDVTTLEFNIDGPDLIKDINGHLYVVQSNGDRYLVGSWSMVHFVVSGDRLYLVFQTIKDQKLVVMVYALREEENKWERVRSIGDQIFFVGEHFSFTLPDASKNLPKWKPDSICIDRPVYVYTDEFIDLGLQYNIPEGMDCLSTITHPKYWEIFSLFDMNDEESGLVSFEELPMEAYTRLFFPPPSWVKWRCPRVDNVAVRFDWLGCGELR